MRAVHPSRLAASCRASSRSNMWSASIIVGPRKQNHGGESRVMGRNSSRGDIKQPPSDTLLSFFTLLAVIKVRQLDNLARGLDTYQPPSTLEQPAVSRDAQWHHSQGYSQAFSPKDFTTLSKHMSLSETLISLPRSEHAISLLRPTTARSLEL